MTEERWKFLNSTLSGISTKIEEFQNVIQRLIDIETDKIQDMTKAAQANNGKERRIKVDRKSKTN